MTTVLISTNPNIRARFISLVIDDSDSTLKTTYVIEQNTSEGWDTLKTKTIISQPATFAQWEADLGAIVRPAIQEAIEIDLGITS